MYGPLLRVAVVGYALNVLVFAGTAFAQDGPGFETVTAVVRQQFAGFENNVVNDFALDRPVSLRGVTYAHLDSLVQVIAGTGGGYGAGTTVSLVSDGIAVGQVANAGVFGGGTIEWMRTIREGTNFLGTAATADAIRLASNSGPNGNNPQPPGLVAFRGLHEGDLVKIHLVRGNVSGDGVHAVRQLNPGGLRRVDGEGASAWVTTRFADPVFTEHLAFVTHTPASNWLWSGTGGTHTESEFLLDDDTTFRLDDSFSPPTGETESGRIAACNSRVIDDELRARLAGRSIVGWRWRIFRQGAGFAEVTPSNPTQALFVYDFPDCNGNGLSDDEEIAAGTVDDCDANGVPDACDTDCNSNGIPDACELAASPELDCDEDGRLDVCQLDAEISLEEVDTIELPGSPRWVVAGDFNGDGLQDLRGVTSSRSLFQLDRESETSFSAVQEGPVDENFSDVAVGDIDGDGRDELAAVWRDPAVGFYGTDIAEPPSVLSLDLDAREIALTHVNSDPHLDLILVHRSDDRVSIHLGDGNGRFIVSQTLAAGDSPRGLAVFDPGGRAERFAVFSTRDDAVYVFAPEDGEAWRPKSFPFDSPRGLAFLKRDGAPDLAISHRLSVHIFRDGGSRDYEECSEIPARGDLSSADIDGDGIDELLVTSGTQAELLIYGGMCGERGVESRLVTGTSAASSVTLESSSRGIPDVLVLDSRASRLVWLANRSRAAGASDCDASGVLDSCELARGVLADENGDGVPDLCEGVRFVRGDVNSDSELNISDAVGILNHLFLGAAAPGCEASADVDGNSSLELADAVALVNFLFAGGQPPAAPYPDCGTESTVGPEHCLESNCH